LHLHHLADAHLLLATLQVRRHDLHHVSVLGLRCEHTKEGEGGAS
jgi:hypothetical protein